MRFKFLLLIVCIVLSCKGKKDADVVENVKVSEEVEVQADVDLEVYDFEGFQKFLNRSDDKTYVINFWATWCAPCIKELPYFEKLNADYQNVEVVLVSLDFPHVYDKKLKPFIIKKELKSKVIALNDPNENEWINKIDESWSGSIPATIIYKKDNRKFFERSFTFEELENEVKQF
ncbi:TlpA family protein disulfide reductase [Hyunsoonleella sp. SJ7]|uniref:TlpA family protein disulfide reductase n=1 Tax=Hyunsoonleella aquatilis TaxID=2762758 RepID=A0A923H8I6_9FLAO|nr:TlpA disulfide reductase family protein [Hyunsoonleella aquatilis]MBC3757399.1 TlpA family protein disulfide reductase [Hyunsoonleella aquatilis]